VIVVIRGFIIIFIIFDVLILEELELIYIGDRTIFAKQNVLVIGLTSIYE
jgi:hypothetical protein